MKFFLFVVVTLTIVYGYVGFRLIVPARLKFPWRLAAWSFLLLILLMPPMSIMIRKADIATEWAEVFAWIGYTGLGMFAFLFTFLVLRDLAWLIVLLFRKGVSVFAKPPGNPVEKNEMPDRERRLFLVNSMNAGIMAGCGALTGYGIYHARRRPHVETVKVPIKNLPVDLEGFRIVQITDVHVSDTVKRAWVENMADIVNSLHPDIVALTGDVVDGSVYRMRGDVAPLSDIRSKRGNYFVTGNHEYYSGAAEWIKEIDRLGFHPLINESGIIQQGTGKILLGGVTDYRAGFHVKDHASSPERALSGAPDSDVKILLAHQPKSVFDAAKAGFDLQISGHTHGGQLFPWNFVVSLDQPFVSGLNRFRDTQIYVSKGTGYWGPPVRVGAPSEITLIRLTRA